MEEASCECLVSSARLLGTVAVLSGLVRVRTSYNSRFVTSRVVGTLVE